MSINQHNERKNFSELIIEHGIFPPPASNLFVIIEQDWENRLRIDEPKEQSSDQNAVSDENNL